MDTINSRAMERALQDLLEKYGIAVREPVFLSERADSPGGKKLLPGNELIESELQSAEIPLLPWRVKRPFTELRKIVAEAVVEHVCLLRFSCLASADEWSLPALVYQEADLCEYIAGGRIESVFAVCDKNRSANIIARLDTGVLCSIEISLQLPPGEALQERHEIIGRRGAAADRVVDTQVPQHSVYCFTGAGDQHFTDTDMELFGFDPWQTAHIRGAFEVCKNPGLQAIWTEQHRHLTGLVHAVSASAETQQKMTIS